MTGKPIVPSHMRMTQEERDIWIDEHNQKDFFDRVGVPLAYLAVIIAGSIMFLHFFG